MLKHWECILPLCWRWGSNNKVNSQVKLEHAENERLTSFQPFQPSFSQRVAQPRGRTEEPSHPASCDAHWGMPCHPYAFSRSACSSTEQGSCGTWGLPCLSLQPWLAGPLGQDALLLSFPQWLQAVSQERRFQAITFFFFLSFFSCPFCCRIVLNQQSQGLNCYFPWYVYVKLALQQCLQTTPFCRSASSLSAALDSICLSHCLQL